MGNRTTHGGGDKNDRLYAAWMRMRSRCHNPNSQDYKNYGGRGVKICTRWADFGKYRMDVGPHPGPGWSLDRLKDTDNYSPATTRWANKKQQARNRRGVILTQLLADKIRTEYKQGNTTYSILGRKYGVCKSTISHIMNRRQWNP